MEAPNTPGRANSSRSLRMCSIRISISQGCNLFPLWNRAPPGLLEPSERALQSLWNRCGGFSSTPEEQAIASLWSPFFFFFNEAGQERIMDSLLLTLWLGSDTFPGELRGHYPVSCPADPSWGWQRKQLLILIPFSSAVNTLKLLLTLY